MPRLVKIFFFPLVTCYSVYKPKLAVSMASIKASTVSYFDSGFAQILFFSIPCKHALSTFVDSTDTIPFISTKFLTTPLHLSMSSKALAGKKTFPFILVKFIAYYLAASSMYIFIENSIWFGRQKTLTLRIAKFLWFLSNTLKTRFVSTTRKDAVEFGFFMSLIFFLDFIV